MNNSKSITQRRPLSHKPLLTFKKNDEFIMDDPKEFLNDAQWKTKFTLQNLREKWKRKLNTNFNVIDHKFGSFENKQKNVKITTEEDERNSKKLFDILHGMYFDASDNNDNKENKVVENYIKKNSKNKYDPKFSYYLSTNNPWNNDVLFENDDKKLINQKINENINEAHKINNYINSKNKNYKSIKEQYNRKNYLIKEAKTNKFIEEETNKLYEKIVFENPGIERYPEKVNALLNKGMKNLYNQYIEFVDNKNNLNNNKVIKKGYDPVKLSKQFQKENNLNSKHYFTDKEIFEKLQILLAYIKENKNTINAKEFLKPLLLDYNKIMQKVEILKQKDIKYQNFINSSEKIKKNKDNEINISKYPINAKVAMAKAQNVYSYHKVDLGEENEIIQKNKNINYFLTAYKNVYDENCQKKNSQNKRNNIDIIISSKNPYRVIDKFKKLNTNDNKTNENEKKEINEKEKNVNKKKRPMSSGSVTITYYHPGSYYLFHEGEKDYHAWSCCMNEDRYSKGCSKKVEKSCRTNYKDHIIYMD